MQDPTVTDKAEPAAAPWSRQATPWNALKADTHRQYGCFSWTRLVAGILTRRTFRVVATMRLCQAAHASRGLGRLMLPLWQALHRITQQRAGLDLPWRTSIGPGLSIAHGWGLVVNARARLGRNVTLFHGTTIGQRDRLDQGGTRISDTPTVDDDVWIGPHAVVVGGVCVGRGSRIAAGALVAEDVPSYSIMQGNPAKVVKRNCMPDVVHPSPL